MTNIFEERNTSVFNSPLELGLRALFLLNAMNTNKCDLHRLIIYDYFLIYSSDVQNGPESIHASTPHRSAEMLVKKDKLRLGINLLISKELIKVNFTSKGIVYSATDLTKPFLKFYRGEYSEKLRTNSKWVIDTFLNYTDKKLDKYINSNLDKWGGEFTMESLFRGNANE